MTYKKLIAVFTIFIAGMGLLTYTSCNSVSSISTDQRDSVAYDSIKILQDVDISYPDSTLHGAWSVIELTNKMTSDTFLTPRKSRKYLDSLLPSHVIGDTCAYFKKYFQKDLEPLLTTCIEVHEVINLQKLIQESYRYSDSCNKAPWECGWVWSYYANFSREIVPFVSKTEVPDTSTIDACTYVMPSFQLDLQSTVENRYQKVLAVKYVSVPATSSCEAKGTTFIYTELGSFKVSGDGVKFTPDSCQKEGVLGSSKPSPTSCDSGFVLSSMGDTLMIPISDVRRPVFRSH